MLKATTTVPNIEVYIIRLKPGCDLKIELDSFASEQGITAGWIASVAGSLTVCTIRFANQSVPYISENYFEIVGLSGTIAKSGSHLHIILADKNGATIAGHLLQGCKIYTTAEIVIQSSNKYIFNRVKDENTGFNELEISET